MTLVIAHRGSSWALPEHTLDAYRRAIDEGADGLECDVRLTRDGHLICIHDGRLDRTSNGHGLVSSATLDDLRQLDFGSWHPHDPAPAEVLTLDLLLQTALSAGRPLTLLIETKHPSRFGGLVERRLVELLRRYRLAGDEARPAPPVQVVVMSFSPLALRRMRLLAPAVPTVFLFELAVPRLREGRPPNGVAALGPGINVVRNHPDLVRRGHAEGHQVYVWTVNQPADVDLVLGLGVDGVISDRPAYVLSQLGR
ncbi:MAG TPA: glycerophosphodiester phosphodiesterase family protein [Micromonosporaceae bacterium]